MVLLVHHFAHKVTSDIAESHQRKESASIESALGKLELVPKHAVEA